MLLLLSLPLLLFIIIVAVVDVINLTADDTALFCDIGSYDCGFKFVNHFKMM